MKGAAFFILLVIMINTSCSESGESEPALYFRGGMDSVSVVNVGGTLKFEGWPSLQNHELVNQFEFNNQGGIAYAFEEITTNPFDVSEKVLRSVVLDDDPNVSGTTRAQATFLFNDGVVLDVYHTSIRMLIDEDVAFLKNYPGNISWFVIYEAWNDHVDTWDGDGAGSARWNLNLRKETSGTELFWLAQAETMQPAAVEGDAIWAHENKTVPVPFNKWFTLDVYLKRGEGTNGRFLIKLTPDGENTIVLFDVKETTIYPGHPEIRLLSLQPIKFYFNDLYLDWMKSNNKTLACYYNDFKWYKK